MKKLFLLTLVSTLFLFVSSCGQGAPILRVNDPAPDFTLKDLEGKTWTLSELKGQVVFINFWATWCPPCLKELPSMQQLYATLPKENFKMLAVLNKDKPITANFIAGQKGLTMPILDDSDNLAGSQYSLTGLPETFIVDKQGILREKFIGPVQWDAPVYVDMIKKYMNQ